MIEHLPCDRSLAENRRRTMKKKCWAIISCTVMLVLMLVQVSLAEDYLSCRNRCYLKFSECLRDAQTTEPAKATERRALCESKNTECLKDCESLKQSTYDDGITKLSLCHAQSDSHDTM